MAKKRKTRAEKKLADNRHTFSIHTYTQTLEPKAPMLEMPERKKEIYSYPYLAKDLTKTAILSSAIIAFQIILFFILKNHLIVIPGIFY